MSEKDEAVKEEAVVSQDTTPTESAPVENKEPEVAEPIDWDESSKKEEPKEETVSEEQAPAEETPEEQSQGEEEKPLAPKSENRFQKLANENRELKKIVEAAVSQGYQVQSPEELVDEGMSELEAKVESMRQEREVEKYTAQVVEVNSALENESLAVLRDFPMFDPESDQYNEELATQARDILVSGLQVDPNTNQIIGYTTSPYKLYKALATSHQSSSLQGQIKGQKAAERQLASVDNVGSAAPPKQKSDPIMDIWKED